MFTKRDWRTFDIFLVFLVSVAVVFGVIAIGSALGVNRGEDPYYRNMQIVWFLTGLGLMVLFTVVDYNFIGKIYILIYIVNIGLLVATLLFGYEVNNAVRWLKFGPIGIQPSEFSKIMMLLVIAKILDKNKQRINNIFVIILVLTIAVIPVFLIQKQPSLSASLVIVAILIIELFVAKISYKYIVVAIVVAVAAISFILWDVQRENSFLAQNGILYNHQVERILGMLDPEGNPDTVYQLKKAINALGSGQLYGKGLYQGMINSQKNYLPEPHTDFIFAVIGEEFGFVGCMGVLGLLGVIIIKCIITASRAEDFFGKLIAAGVAGMFAFQTFVHVGVTIGILPTTGMPLPFFSYGGSSMWTNMIAIGLVLNVGTKRVKTTFF